MSLWAVLGLEPTVEAKAIRRAYAARLRSIDAERDPRHSSACGHAYEAALRGAEDGVGRDDARAVTAGGTVERAEPAAPAPDHALGPSWPPRSSASTRC
ncbi:MAG: hypothetical protein U1E53_20145 [Dongiaceae bacterium]